MICSDVMILASDVNDLFGCDLFIFGSKCTLEISRDLRIVILKFLSFKFQ